MDDDRFFLNHVAKHCTKLYELNIKYKSMEKDNGGRRGGYPTTKNYSIRKLIVSQWALTEGQFFCLTIYFPCLDILIIDYFFEQHQIVEEGTFMIPMPDTALTYLEITMQSNSLNYIYGAIRLTLNTDQKCRSFLFVNDSQTSSNQFKLFKTSSEISSQLANRSGRVYSIIITCRSIEKFTLKFDGIKNDGVVGSLSVDIYASDDIE
jgi:hypothetical protein